MSDEQKTPENLLDELARLRRENEDLARALADQKRLGEALRGGEQRYRGLVEISHDMYFIVDRDDTVLYVNPAAAAAFGRSPGELIGRRRADLFPPEVSEHQGRNLRRVFETGLPLAVEDRTAFPGRDIWLDSNLIPIRDGSGEVTSVLGISRDITDRKRAEEALRLSELQYRTTLDSMADPTHVADADLRIVLFNAAFQQWNRELGLPTDVIGRGVFEVFPFLAERVREEYREVLDSGRLVISENTIVVGDRTCITETRKIPIFGEGRVVQVITVVRDITEKRRAEEARLRAEKLESLGLLAGGIAHDFNNLLTGIIGNLSLVQWSLGDDDHMLEALDDAQKAADRARRLARQLLTFSRGGAPDRQPASIADLLKETAVFALAGSSVRCNFTIQNDLWPANVDRDQFCQVVQNLVINAGHAVPEGGVIDVDAGNVTLRAGELPPLKEGDYVRVTIRDHGVGIPEKHLPKVFDPYFTTKATGSGLGLPVAHAIVRHHDGHIRVDSTVGVGTTVTVYLPASRGSLPAEDQEAARALQREARILVMDDEAAVRNAASRLLKALGCEVERADDGAEAIRLYRAARAAGRPFDAVLLDLTVPGSMGGKECLQRLLRIDPDARAIASSGYSDEPILTDFRKHGFRGAVPKPYTLEALSEALQHVLQPEEAGD